MLSQILPPISLTPKQGIGDWIMNGIINGLESIMEKIRNPLQKQ